MESLLEFESYATNLLVTTIKVAWPSYATFKAIVSVEEGDDSAWLVYWVIVGLESFLASYILPFVSWIPFFLIVRVVFYIWLQLPVFNGSVILFTKVVQPFMEAHSREFDVIASPTGRASRQLMREVTADINELYEAVLEAIEEAAAHEPRASVEAKKSGEEANVG
jgi:receptor expression-enhancing protein 5/6